MAALKDPRQRRQYSVGELVMGGIAMFIFKEDSRNAFQQDRKDQLFQDNYFKIFKLRSPHPDTVDAFLKLLLPEEIEELKMLLVSRLIEQKVLQRFKLLGKFFLIAIDATGTNSYTTNDKEQSRTKKTSKNGVTTYYHFVAEAKLVTESGLSISLASEWIANDTGRDFDKQDCEQKAFHRLSAKIKKHFPRLPVCILADGLYPNAPFMETCRKNQWEFVVVLKDNNLKTLQEDIKDVENKHRHSLEITDIKAKGNIHVHQKYEWVAEQLKHDEHIVYWLSCTETVTNYNKNRQPTVQEPTRFVWLSSAKVDKCNVRDVARAGRMRWKIENEGFNIQKNGGYNLGHKFSRTSFTAYKNYYQCMQIAHLINQLVEHSNDIAEYVEKATLTIKSLWQDIRSMLKMIAVNANDFQLDDRFQIRLAG